MRLWSVGVSALREDVIEDQVLVQHRLLVFHVEAESHDEAESKGLSRASVHYNPEEGWNFLCSAQAVPAAESRGSPYI